MRERGALVALGAWLMGSIAMILVATRNFHLVDELLQSSANLRFHALARSLGAGSARDFLRYLSSELNREYFYLWTATQFPLGVLTCLSLPRERRRLAMLATLLAALELSLTPWITSVGRSLDFVPHEPAPPALDTFWKLHITFSVLDVAKLILVVVAIFLLVRGQRPLLLEETDAETAAPD
jgi:hypothetical protein